MSSVGQPAWLCYPPGGQSNTDDMGSRTVLIGQRASSGRLNLEEGGSVNGKRSIKKAERNLPVKKSIRVIKAKKDCLDESEQKKEQA